VSIDIAHASSLRLRSAGAGLTGPRPGRA